MKTWSFVLILFLSLVLTNGCCRPTTLATPVPPVPARWTVPEPTESNLCQLLSDYGVVRTEEMVSPHRKRITIISAGGPPRGKIRSWEEDVP